MSRIEANWDYVYRTNFGSKLLNQREWFSNANELVSAAEILAPRVEVWWDSLEKWRKDKHNLPREHGYHRIFLMLYAYAIENFCKGFIVGKDIMETAEIKGTSAEFHVKITTPELTEKDFRFTLPEGTILKKSLFGSILGDEGYMSPDPTSSDKKILAKRMEKYLSAVCTGKDEECFKLISPICIKNMGLTLQKFSEECQSLRNTERIVSTHVEHVLIKDDLKHAEVLVTKDSWIRYGDAMGAKIEEKREVGNPVYFWVKEGDTWYIDFGSNGNIY